MSTQIRTSHAGSLPRSEALIAANRAKREEGRAPADFGELLRGSVVEIVARQRELGLSEPNDGEYGHTMASPLNFGAWWHYSFERTGGLELAEGGLYNATPAPAAAGGLELTSFEQRRDRQAFPGAYRDEAEAIHPRHNIAFPTIVGPLTYTGQEAVAADIADLKAGLAAAGYEESRGFLNSLAPGSAARIGNSHYATDEEVVWAWADVLREEYLAITEAGLIVQIDDPSIAESWDQISPEPSYADYRAYIQVRIDALNHALRGIDPQRVRFHTCWGSWHGPHTTDIPFAEIVDQVLSVNAAGLTFEGANARHEHEWRIWEDTALPDGKYLIPGIVSHATNVVEHPELVAERIERYARLVGPERVVASTDCGLGGRIHPEIAFAKLASLVEGARLASARF
ncbi:methionine synthase [Brevibacterium sp. 5221]|uniref:Methionine synthase n=1 Tax=Brevibacterium rongguiense TaxID=2695267 RepID=A0A6N9H4G0_9MICO|nr:cobalamin-independent methionine synthase II family protein [Brevibacterium rongguiense]MYM18799.1 methionine synthase [Brevibacterium rongguiense]